MRGSGRAREATHEGGRLFLTPLSPPQYTPNSDGTLKVVNSCRKKSITGQETDFVGTATIPDQNDKGESFHGTSPAKVQHAG